MFNHNGKYDKFVRMVVYFSFKSTAHNYGYVVDGSNIMAAIINPRCACAARVIVVVVCVCVTTHNCRLTHWNHKTKIPTSS